jgi:hypothetical protein
MDASQLWYREVVDSGPKHKFCIFLHAEGSEMLWNTPNHHFGSNRVEWILRKFGTRNSAFRPETQLFHLFTSWKLGKSFETLPNIIFGPVD